jgi:SdrD B-like protein
MKFRAPFVFLAFCLAGEMFFSSAAVSQAPPDSARWRVYLTVTDSLTHKPAQASFGFHPKATLGLDTALMFGFRDHWDQADTPYMRELPSPPLGFFQELRVNNVRQKFTDNGLLFGNIHPYTGPAMVDTFIVSFNGDANFLGDSLYLYTHPQILTWPSVLASYADSIILRDISNSQQTAAGPHVHVDMTHDSTFTYFGDNYFDPGTSTYTVDPLHKGFFMTVYHPKISPGPPVVTFLSPPNGVTNRPSHDTLRWAAVPGGKFYKVQMDTNRAFTDTIFTDSSNATSKAISGLHRNPWYYWRVITENSYGVGYYQDPPDSFASSPGAISGIVFNDLDGNGLQDPGDTGLPNWRVLLRDLSNTLLDSTLTGAGGVYHFSGLTAGQYILSEREQDTWIQTAPPAVGSLTVAISKGDSSSGNNFGDIAGVVYTGPPNGDWSTPSNWSGGQVPGPSTPAIIPANTNVVLNSLPNETILYLKVQEGGSLTCTDPTLLLTVTKSIQIDPGGSIQFPNGPSGTTDLSAASDTGGIVDYADFINNGTFIPGHSSVTFAGNSPKIIMSTDALTPGGTNFYDLTIAGDSVTSIGNITVLHQLTLDYSLKQRREDTLAITNNLSTAVTGTGAIPDGSVSRAILQSDTGAYRFGSVNSFLKFDGTGSYPSNVIVTTLPDTAPRSFHLDWLVVGGTNDTVGNTIRASSVTHFSKWAMGVPRPGTTMGEPVVDREYVLKSAGGGGFTATVSLGYEQGEVPPGTVESELRLLRGPCVTDSLPEKWNMVSLPLLADDPRKDSLFPGASSPAFGYDAGYVVQPNLTMGQGYWLRYPGPRRVQIIGDEVEQDTIGVSAGWNMIGTVSYPQGTSSISSIPPGIITSRVFGYAGGYHVADSLKPLHGYWVKTSAPGQLVLSSSGGSAKVSPPSSQLTRFNSLVFHDAAGNEQSLYFGRDGKLDLRQFELPPLPPEGVFDVRFSTQRMLELKDPQRDRSIPILIASAAYPVAIRWSVREPSSRAFLLVDGKSIDLSGNGGVELAGAATPIRLLLSSGPGTAIPKEFSLLQNYPNPFNPATVIEYQLPVASSVTLKIYNLLGQEVATLVRGVQEAGYRSARWDAAGIGSGVYFYRLDATSTTDPSRSFTKVKKMLLLR